MPAMLNAAVYMKKWGGKRMKGIRRNFRRNRGAGLINNKTKSGTKLMWMSSFDKCGEEKSLSITIRMLEKEDRNQSGFNNGNVIFYKDDEDRFSQQCTLKLKTFTLYNMALEVSQEHNLVYVVIGGKKYNCFRLFDNPDNATKVYLFTWSTDKIKTTPRKFRTIVPVEMKFKDYEELKFQLSVKFYYRDDAWHCSGVPLTLIDVQGEVGVGDLHQTVLNTISFE